MYHASSRYYRQPQEKHRFEFACAEAAVGSTEGAVAGDADVVRVSQMDAGAEILPAIKNKVWGKESSK